MELGDYIARYRKDAGLTIEELASLSGVPKGTINKIIAGTTKSPTLETIQCLAAALGKSINDFVDAPSRDELSSGEKKHIKKYRLLDDYGKEAVDSVLNVEWQRCAAMTPEAPAQAAEETVYFMVPWFFQAMSAGNGEEAGNEQPEDLRLTKTPPRGTSYIAPISGDSMEPTYHNGDLVFVQATTAIRPGQVGVFFMDGQQWIKELGDGVLISHNPAYPPRLMTADIRCQGLVLGVCDESYFA